MDYEVNEDGVFYDEDHYDEGDGEESDPLALSSNDHASDQDAREEIFGPYIDDLIAETQSKQRKRKKRRLAGAIAPKRVRQSEVPSHLSAAMGAATASYMTLDFKACDTALARIVKEAPKAAAPYRLWGLIHEERKEHRKALDAYMTAAELDKQDQDLWKRNAVLWEEQGDLDQAIYCLTRALRATKGHDLDALRARAEFRLRQGQRNKAADSYIKLAKLLPHDISIVKKIVNIFKDTGAPGKAIPVLNHSIEYFQQDGSRRDVESMAERNGILSELVQLLIEIWFTQKKYSESSALLARMNARFSASGSPLTFVQRLLLAICQHRLGEGTLASPTFIEFMSSPSMMAKHSGLLWEVAEACRDSGDYAKAVKAYNLLVGHTAYAENVDLLMHRAMCCKELGNMLACKSDLQKVLQIKPRHVEASIRLSQFYPHIPTERQLQRERKRRERRYMQMTSAKVAELALLQSQLKAPNPEAPASERESNWSSIGYDYLRVKPGRSVPSGSTTRDAILVPVSHDNVRDALQILSAANIAFRDGNMKLFLSMVGPPVESALNLQTKLNVVDDEASEEEDEESESSDDDINEHMHRFGNDYEPCSVNPKSPDVKPVGECQGEPSKQDVAVSNVPNFFQRESKAPCQENDTRQKWAQPALKNETDQNVNGIGVAMLREIAEDLFVCLLEKIFRALYDIGRIQDIEQIMSSLLSLAAVRIGPESPLKLRMQVLLVASLFATGRFFDAHDKLRSMLIENPEDTRICCLFALAEEHLGVMDNNERFRSFRVLKRLEKKKPDLPILAYVTGLCSARGITNSHNYTLGKYLRAYAIVPDSPLLCLCSVVQLLYVAQGRRVGNRNQVVVYAMAFLDEYRRKRRKIAFEKCQLVVELEIQYNFARVMHQLGINHMAAELYLSVINFSDANTDRLPPWADLRRDAAHNLAFIYKQSGSLELARALISKYLVF